MSEWNMQNNAINKKSKIPFFIGPCMLESLALCLKIADTLVHDLKEFESDIQLFFKGSFDKANRTSIDSYRGPGLELGLEILSEVKRATGLPVLTDYHLPDQAEVIAGVVDVLQVPAFLCRQTDMIVAGAQACKKFNRSLKMKKGQFLSPMECENMVQKAASFLPKERIYLTERGNSFGYQNLVVDMANFQVMKSFGVRVIFDATHSAQRPGALGKSTGGKRDTIPFLARAAMAAGADGIFMETHPEPNKALSDAATQIPLDQMKIFIRELIQLKQVVDKFHHFSW